MQAQVQALSQSYVLTLYPSSAGWRPLAAALREVLHGQPGSVWVDCRYVSALPAGALRLLRRCAACLWQRGSCLVLCHLPAAIRAELATDATQPLAASLLDAQQYGLDLPVPPAA